MCSGFCGTTIANAGAFARNTVLELVQSVIYLIYRLPEKGSVALAEYAGPDAAAQ